MSKHLIDPVDGGALEPPKSKSDTPVHRPRNRSATTDPEFLAKKIRLANAQAEKVEIQNAKARGELLPATDVKAEWSRIVVDTRQALLAVPSRLTVDRATADMVDREIRLALTGLADDLIG